MQIIWNEQAAQELRKTHTVLELETFEVDGKNVTSYCVVGAEHIPITELPQLNRWIEFHEAFVQAMKDGNQKLCEDTAEHLVGKFGGELDSFYEIILGRFQPKPSS